MMSLVRAQFGEPKKETTPCAWFFLWLFVLDLRRRGTMARLAEHMIEFLLETRIVGLPTIGHMVELVKHSPIFLGLEAVTPA